MRLRRDGITARLSCSFNFLTIRVGEESDDFTCTAVRSPRLGSIGWFDFQRASEAIKIGANTTEKAIDQINEAVAALSHPVTANTAPK